MVASYYFLKVRVSFHLQDMYWIDRRLKSNEPNTFVDPSAAHSLQLASVSKLIRDADHFITNCFRFRAALHAGSKLKLGNTVLLPKNKTKHNTTKRIDEIPTFRTRWHVYKTFPVTAWSVIVGCCLRCLGCFYCGGVTRQGRTLLLRNGCFLSPLSSAWHIRSIEQIWYGELVSFWSHDNKN